jgi:hypothetical protein
LPPHIHTAVRVNQEVALKSLKKAVLKRKPQVFESLSWIIIHKKLFLDTTEFSFASTTSVVSRVI